MIISQWPADAPRGSVSTFCKENNISREAFYFLRRRAINEGQEAVLELKSRKLKNSPK
jgi:hypothetical protein